MHAIISKTVLKNWFKRGAKPRENQFAAWIDSYWHKDESIPIGSIDELQNILSNKADTVMVRNAIADAVANVTVKDASLTQKGIVQLTNEFGSSDSLAATQSLVTQLAICVMDLWLQQPGNENKTAADFFESLNIKPESDG